MLTRLESSESNTNDINLDYQLTNGRKAYFDFQSDDQKVKIVRKQKYIDNREISSLKEQIENAEDEKLDKLKGIINKSRVYLLRKQFDKYQGEKSDDQYKEAPDEYQLIRTQRRQEVSKPHPTIRIETEAEVQKSLSKQNDIKKKIDSYVSKKFKYSGFLTKSLTKSLRLTKEKQSTHTDNSYEFGELKQRQKQMYNTLRKEVSLQNLKYFQYDLNEIKNYLNH